MDQMTLNKFKAWAMQPGLETFPANSEEIMWAIEELEKVQKLSVQVPTKEIAVDALHACPNTDCPSDGDLVGLFVDNMYYVKCCACKMRGPSASSPELAVQKWDRLASRAYASRGLIQERADIANALAPIGCNPIMPLAPQVEAVVEELLRTRRQVVAMCGGDE